MFKDFLNSKLTGATIDSTTGLKAMPKTQAAYVEFGYGQVEPNHLSAQRNGQIYAQLPAKSDIEILEQGQFVKYDYAANGNGIGEVNFTGAGEWMLVYNEIKLYRNHIDGSKQWDCEFAMLKDDYQARVYSPYDWEATEEEYHNALYLNGKDASGKTSIKVTSAFVINPSLKTVDIDGTRYDVTYDSDTDKYTLVYNGTTYTTAAGDLTFNGVEVEYPYDDYTRDTEDPYEFNYTNDPWMKLGLSREKMMPKGTSMVPRVFKTMVGDIFTTNMIADEEVAIKDVLAPNAKGILSKSGDTTAMKWEVVKLYTMPDGQKGVKLMRIA